MSEWILDEFMEAWQAIQNGEVTGDVQVIMRALDAGNRRIANNEYENKQRLECSNIE